VVLTQFERYSTNKIIAKSKSTMVFLQWSSSRLLLRSVTVRNTPAICATLQRLPFSSSALGDGESKEMVGMVIKYDRAKCFGHIRLANATRDTPDIFVHRSGIESDLPANDFPGNPFLNQKETVKFRVEPTDRGGFHATSVTFSELWRKMMELL
jgi:cold shock CspA family protein